MTAHEVEKFRQVADIDWGRIARAFDFYKKRGYHYVELPWAVPENIVRVTLPEGGTPHCVAPNTVLVGSAEQGFLDSLEQKKNITPGVLYFAISPCFRGEEPVIPGHTQLTFMKVELFALEKLPPARVLPFHEEFERLEETLLYDAQEFMSTEGAQVQRIVTPEGVDLFCGGIELGSYGTRSWRDYRWSYGTGVAEPRFSTALSEQLLKRSRWLHRVRPQR